MSKYIPQRKGYNFWPSYEIHTKLGRPVIKFPKPPKPFKGKTTFYPIPDGRGLVLRRHGKELYLDKFDSVKPSDGKTIFQGSKLLYVK